MDARVVDIVLKIRKLQAEKAKLLAAREKRKP
jgi:hypothetical protein